MTLNTTSKHMIPQIAVYISTLVKDYITITKSFNQNLKKINNEHLLHAVTFNPSTSCVHSRPAVSVTWHRPTYIAHVVQR
jgi:hypothetical protein